MLKPLHDTGFCPICNEHEDECECPRYPATMDKYRVNLRAPGELLSLSIDNGGGMDETPAPDQS